MLDFLPVVLLLVVATQKKNFDMVNVAVYIFALSLHCYGPLRVFNLKPNNCVFKDFLFPYCIEYPK